jgi:hypothetical protein
MYWLNDHKKLGSYPTLQLCRKNYKNLHKDGSFAYPPDKCSHALNNRAHASKYKIQRVLTMLAHQVIVIS